ncbi:hypothetical protein G7K_6181-t1 [Saitoella complicata NRRL Y-17804]|uniref:Uncharacterized protein n=2 Tax=Saitoella complicata (strain BCRC 22490 / CBS 7301 / JCM 7358 / NBRC 10748 / NRRL Y-17804) TaxID=698492 RepID=A0A0E9NRP5_SAICN|nr:hypothetical protein G7K_6181-t1 [Saitoella complicata NRRL Y-17804]
MYLASRPPQQSRRDPAGQPPTRPHRRAHSWRPIRSARGLLESPSLGRAPPRIITNTAPSSAIVYNTARPARSSAPPSIAKRHLFNSSAQLPTNSTLLLFQTVIFNMRFSAGIIAATLSAGLVSATPAMYRRQYVNATVDASANNADTVVVVPVAAQASLASVNTTDAALNATVASNSSAADAGAAVAAAAAAASDFASGSFASVSSTMTTTITITIDEWPVETSTAAADVAAASAAAPSWIEATATTTETAVCHSAPTVTYNQIVTDPAQTITVATTEYAVASSVVDGTTSYYVQTSVAAAGVAYSDVIRARKTITITEYVDNTAVATNTVEVQNVYAVSTGTQEVTTTLAVPSLATPTTMVLGASTYTVSTATTIVYVTSTAAVSTVTSTITSTVTASSTGSGAGAVLPTGLGASNGTATVAPASSAASNATVAATSAVAANATMASNNSASSAEEFSLVVPELQRLYVAANNGLLVASNDTDALVFTLNADGELVATSGDVVYFAGEAGALMIGSTVSAVAKRDVITTKTYTPEGKYLTLAVDAVEYIFGTEFVSELHSLFAGSFLPGLDEIEFEIVAPFSKAANGTASATSAISSASAVVASTASATSAATAGPTAGSAASSAPAATSIVAPFGNSTIPAVRRRW